MARIDTLYTDPRISPEEFLEMQPHLRIGDVVLIQPSSSVFVFALGLIAILVALYFFRTKIFRSTTSAPSVRSAPSVLTGRFAPMERSRTQASRLWWGVALLFWGVGAVSAGLSYQSFGYMLKCDGRPFCLYTSLPEILYSVLTIWAIAAMTIAQSRTSASGRTREIMRGAAFLSAGVYTVLSIIGMVLANRFLLSFTLLVLFIAPFIVLFFVLDISVYQKTGSLLHRRLIICWILLGLTMVAYYAYSLAGLTEALWMKGIWFSDNDVLHLALIGWMLYLRYGMGPHMEDFDRTDVY